MGKRNSRHRHHGGRDSATGHVDGYFQRRKRYETALRTLGLAESFARMPRGAQEHFWKCKDPDPVLVFDDSFPVAMSVGDGVRRRTLRRELEERFGAAAVEINGATMSVRDLLSVISGCIRVVQQTREAGLPEEVVAFVRQALPELKRVYDEQLPVACRSLYYAIAGPLHAYSRLDTRLLTVRQDRQATGSNGKSQPRLILSALKPQVRDIRLDGSSRPMYRVAQLSPAGTEWISWNTGQLGRFAPASGGEGNNAERQYPVFVQSHALRQLHRRVNLPSAAPYVEAWLAESIAEPNIVERQGSDDSSDLLVEYRIKDFRLGYLVVTPLDNLFAVRTFKFLTMEGTPEARLLKRQLQLTRRDVDWLGLQEMATFTQTDLSDDPVLRSRLEKCGCGHLFKLAEEIRDDHNDCVPQPKAFAAELRRYLRLAA